ncbi:MAG: cbbT [candidate division NC10 bacterium]|nr:cbbT [candidate division NC10 bacterium]
MKTDHASPDQLCINTIRTLAMDAVQKANSGHPGLPMGAAAMAYVLWTRFLRHHPTNPSWPNRDRFILSAGHGCMLLYSLLHLTGYDLPLDELKRFRQWGSRTPGHSEHGLTPGVETTTGPLGQGFGNGVGMAIAERFLANHFNRPGYPIVDHYVYAIVSDGDLMEGVSSEAASLAGHLGLGKLIYLYDDNRITIDGSTSLAFTENVGQRFEAYGWHVQRVDGNDLKEVEAALSAAQAATERPSLIIARTHIAYGSPNKQDTAEAHGAPLGEEEIKLTKRALGWPLEPAFYIPDEALAHFREALQRGRAWEAQWQAQFDAYAAAHPELAAEWRTVMNGRLPEGWADKIPTFTPGGGSITPSNNTYLKGYGDFQRDNVGARNLHFGVREHAMGSILNGMALHGGVIPYGGTFLIFSDYMRPAIRLAALSHIHVIYVFTHDSIGLGEDGPTHEPIEHLASLRAMPNLTVIRPADANETAVAWRVALEHRGGPVALALTRQKLPVLDRTTLASADLLRRGAYVLTDASNGQPDIILIATGSEVQLALEARQRLAAQGIGARVVSMPSWELFEQQPDSYRDEVLPPSVTARLAIEAASPHGWHRYVGTMGAVIGMTRYGASAPYHVLMEQFGFTADNVTSRALALLAG